ncbi:hypothetical protein ACIRBZ_17285 [Streptomyces sp. NPDC094038]|uniref:hypothetical protein n=1 Tax=Streptomyces sp. NPDC094038 TaxID=3366055 RepID=UPI00381E953F
MNVTQGLHEQGRNDDAIRAKASGGRKGEELFFEPAIEDLQRAADLDTQRTVAADLMERIDVRSEAVA